MTKQSDRTWKRCSRRSPTRPGCGFSALLLTGEVCVCDIHESLKIPQPKASRHLAYLRRAGPGRDPAGRSVDSLPAGDARGSGPGAIADAVRHALTHVDAVAKDGERLRKATGCCLKAVEAPRSLACCGEEAPA